jgi:uridine kinase
LCSIDPITRIDHSETRVRMPNDGLLVVDGVSPLRPELDRHWDLRIWIPHRPRLVAATWDGPGRHA